MRGATLKMHYGHFSVVLCLSFVKVAQLKLLAVLHKWVNCLAVRLLGLVMLE